MLDPIIYEKRCEIFYVNSPLLSPQNFCLIFDLIFCKHFELLKLFKTFIFILRKITKIMLEIIWPKQKMLSWLVPIH
jgi:hypothetical protein